MTIPTVTEAEAIARANATYHRVMNAEWPGGKGDDIRLALDGLLDARETYSDLLNDITHPATAYPHLEGDTEAYDKALAMSARDAADWAAELERLVPVETERTEQNAA